MTDTLYDKTDTAKNEKLLKSSRPKNGRLIKEDYTVVNEADAVVNDGGVLKIRAISTN